MHFFYNRLKKNKDLFAGFIDFSKAFDLVNRKQLLLQILDNQIDGKMYWALKSLYIDTISQIKVNDCLTDWFQVDNGVRQGDPLSPTLFSFYINDLIKAIKNLNVWINLNNLLIAILAYADDIILLAESSEDLQRLFDVVSTWCLKWPLQINIGKSAVIHLRSKRVTKTEFQFKLD